MPSEKQIACVADAIDFALGDIKKARLFVDRIELIKDVVRKALTAAEQAEPAIDYLEAFAAQSRKLQAVLRIPGVKECLEELQRNDKQAEPAPAARSGVVKVVEDTYERYPKIMDRLAALEPAEPATDAEREFNEVLNEAEAFNDDLPERMRRNARDWLRPDDEPATDAEPVATVYRKGNVIGQLVWTKAGDHADLPDGTKLYTRPPESRLREALEEIANGCNGRVGRDILPCRIARTALAQEDGR